MWSPTRQHKLFARLGVVLGVWTALAVVFTGQAYLIVYSTALAHEDLPRERPALALTELFLSALGECLIWALLTLGIQWLARRFPFGQGRWLRSLAAHLAACVVCAFVAAVLSGLVAQLVRKELPKPTVSPNVLFLFLVAKLNNNIFFYWAILTVALVFNYYRRWRDRELVSSQLEAKLAQTQLQILKMQLHPHFLFNTLNAISALIHQDVELADQMIARLGDLLRTTLDNANQQEVPFKQELGFIQPYLDIEKARLGPRLTVELEVDPAVLDALVPNLILQPLVENAIRHGIAPRPGPGRIQIRAGRENGSLRLVVKDSGPGLQAPLTPTPLPEGGERGRGEGAAKGIGLANTRARLEKLYGANQRLDLSNGPDGGLRVDITIPYQEPAPQPSEPAAQAAAGRPAVEVA
jgi:two-component system LytT family sensor kinase